MMESDRVPFQTIVFVCVNRREEGKPCCAQRQSEALAAALKERINALGFSRLVRVSKSGCQDLCAQGPNIMVFPEYRWYRGVSLNDVDAIIQDVTRRLPSASTL